jgi:hypothetical protein
MEGKEVGFVVEAVPTAVFMAVKQVEAVGLVTGLF